MRKTAITILLTFAAACAYAQNAYDALLFSENNYEGTARSVAMGNAFTALGGDLGAVTINPASAAVASYGQFTITPALTLSSTTAQGVSPFSDGTLPYFERKMKSNMTDFSMPNIGLSFNWDTHRRTGLKRLTFGFVANKTAGWNEDVYANGMNSTTSYMGALATETNGLLASDLNGEYAYDYMPWNSVVGYQSGMISTFGGYEDEYVGASELVFDNGAIALGGPLEQTYGRHVTGSNYDYAFNVGANISDILYLGANFNITSTTYGYDEYFKETAADPADFEIALDNGETMYFQQMKHKYTYQADASGYSAKFGLILTPGAGFRLGAAIQTPTVTTVDEYWYQDGQTLFTESAYNATAYSPTGEYSYMLHSPFRANFGLAYTIAGLAVISADYEVCDYSQMKFKALDTDRDYFEDVNNDIKERFGTSHMLRAGAEVKIGALAVRGGYGLTTSAEKVSTWGDTLPLSYTQNASFGLGYSSKGSFFADFAVRKNFLKSEYYMPYSDYIFDEDGNIETPAPELLIRKSTWKILLTFGWRF